MTTLAAQSVVAPGIAPAVGASQRVDTGSAGTGSDGVDAAHNHRHGKKDKPLENVPPAGDLGFLDGKALALHGNETSASPFQRMWMAVRSAHSNGRQEDLITGTVGMTLGMLAYYGISGQASTIAGYVGAVVASAAYQVKNGWVTEQASQVDPAQKFPLPGANEVFGGSLRLLRDSIIAGAPFAAAAFLGIHYSDVTEIVDSTAHNMFREYIQGPLNFISEQTRQIIDFVKNPKPQIQVARASFVHDLMETGPKELLLNEIKIFNNIYTNLAPVVVLSSLAFPELRRMLNVYAPAFLLGAVAFANGSGADIGTIIIQILAAFTTAAASGVLVAKKGAGESKRKVLLANIKSLKKFFVASEDNSAPIILAGSLITGGALRLLGEQLRSGLPLFDVSREMPIGQIIENCALNAVKGAAVTVALLPFVYLVVGSLRGETYFPQRMLEGWEDSKGSSVPKRVAGALAELPDAARAGFVQNRTFRAFSIDLISAGFLAYKGWDDPAGQALAQSYNVFIGNPLATWLWNEKTGTRYGREAIQQVYKDRDKDEGYQERINTDKRMGRRELFALSLGVDIRYWIDKFEIYTGIAYEKLDERDIINGLNDLQEMASIPGLRDIVQWELKVICMSRNSPKHGRLFKEFVAQNKQIFDVMGIQEKDYSPVQLKNRRKARREVAMRLKGDGAP